MTTPLDDVEAALVNASNAMWELHPTKRLLRYVELNEAIDKALRLTQAWKEDDEAKG